MSDARQHLLTRFDAESAGVADREALKALRDRWLGRKAGLVTDVRKRMGSIPAEDRAAFGKAFNELQAHVETGLAALGDALTEREREAALARETVDVTIPGRRAQRGHLH